MNTIANKDRLYICLHARGGRPKMPGLEDTYHWALMSGPKVEDETKVGLRYHAKEQLGPEGSQWIFEKKEVPLQPSAMLLTRVVVAKIMDRSRLDSILSAVPVRTGVTGWNCVSWVQEALDSLEADGKALGTRITEWRIVRDTVMQYSQQKRDEGRFREGKYKPHQAPTYDLIQREEILT